MVGRVAGSLNIVKANLERKTGPMGSKTGPLLKQNIVLWAIVKQGSPVPGRHSCEMQISVTRLTLLHHVSAADVQKVVHRVKLTCYDSDPLPTRDVINHIMV